MSALLTLIYREYCRACLAEMQSADLGDQFLELSETSGNQAPPLQGVS